MKVFGFLVCLLGAANVAMAQDRRNEQFYYPGSFNWTFLKVYPEAARLFNAFDYGHAVLYERLLTKPPAEREAALEKEYQFLTTDLLMRPPRFAVAEEVIEPTYAKLVWQAKQMFDWAHLLHRQIYDIYSDERIGPEAKDALIEKVTDYYLTREDLAFTAVPKSMALMDEQYFSQVFRKRHQKFNGLIWAYHWLQVGLYEPLILGQTLAERKSGLQATLARFWSMLEDPPARFPRMMPMTATIAPTFSAAHPRAAVIFDNLHMMHDIISDVLATDTIPKPRKREVIYQQLAEFRDGTRNVMTMDEWKTMGEMMGGIGAMGGPATGHGPPARDSAAAMPPMPRGMSHQPPTKDSTPPAPHADHLASPDSTAPPAHSEHTTTPKRATPPIAGHAMSFFATLVFNVSAAHGASGSAGDSSDVAAVVQRFDALMAAGDSAGILALLADDAVVLESGGMETRAEFRSHHLPADINFARAVKGQQGPITVRVQGDVAWASSTSAMEGELRGRQINSVSAELMVLSRESGGWKIRAIHWSSRNRRPPGR